MFEVYNKLANFFVYELFKFPQGERISEALHFFIYDSLKIFTLLTVVIFVVSFLRSYLPIEKTKHILSKHKAFSLPLSAFLGVLTPFCSCSAVPMFIGFIEAGIPIGAAFTFLVASPMVNEIAIGLLFSIFGKERINFAFSTVKEIIGKIWIYILIAIGIGGFIHGYIPQDLVEKISSTSGILGVPLAVLLGIPLYSNAAGVLPVVQPLIEKGIPIGTALALMMSITALSFPEFLILKQIMKVKLIVIFASIVGVSIIISGYLFNLIL